jgi:hypothetical protein
MRPWHDGDVLDLVHAKGRALISQPSASPPMMPKDFVPRPVKLLG